MINVIAGPTAVGKTTIADILSHLKPSIHRAVSCTTRKRKRDEVNGVDYHFLSREDFERRRKRGDFAECAEVHGEWYGTLRLDLSPALRAGVEVLLVIDVQGMREIKRQYPHVTRSIFIHPPNISTLEERIRRRDRGESEEEIARRLERAQQEICCATEFDYEVVNGSLKPTVREVLTLLGI